MKLPVLQGIIKRRILVNYRAEADVVQRILPAPFRPKLHRGRAIAGICLIGLENIRPKFVPEFIGLDSENAAHRIAVEWEDEKTGEPHEGVYIPRRDTNSFINAAVGGTLFPGEHNRAVFNIEENESEIDFAMHSADGRVSVELKGIISTRLPHDSIFSTLGEASRFFETGSLGYSAASDENHLDGIVLETKDWRLDPFSVNHLRSSFYEDESVFPAGSIEFDHALLMRNIAHEWHSAPSFQLAEKAV